MPTRSWVTISTRRGGSTGFWRHALHAAALGFRHPRDGRWMSFESSLPDDIRALLSDLRRG